MTAWFSLAELTRRGLPSLPSTVRGLSMLAEREGWAMARNARGEALSRPRQGRGGGLEFHVTLLPAAARTALAGAASQLTAAPTREERWAAYDRLPDTKKSAAQKRLAILQAVEAAASTTSRTAAVAAAALEHDVSVASIYAWFKAVEGVDAADRLPLLAPRHAGGQPRIDIDDELFAIFKSDWLRPEKPSDVSCWRRTARIAAARGLSLPPAAVLMRRLRATVSAETILLAREGREAIKNVVPAQRRDRSGLHALEAINCDTHTWDVMVEWPDGTIGRPAMTAAQDLYSNYFLAWRFSRTPSAEIIRLMLGDVFGKFGIPDVTVFDNGRDFASKNITGGTPTRYRWKCRPEDPVGVLTALGVKVHFTKPYSGQSKPIERAFGDFARDIAKHPAFSGAYTGNAPHNKPANYGARAVPFEEFVRVVTAEIHAWNARDGRRSDVAQGRSYESVFRTSYAETVIRKPTPEQLRFCLLMSEAVTPNRRDGSIRLFENTYWSDGMASLIGQRVVVRFDGQNLWAPIYVYSLDGRYLMAAECTERAGFFDIDSGRKKARLEAAKQKATKKLLDAERAIDAEKLARLQASLDADMPSDPAPDTKVVRLITGAITGQAAALARADAFEPDPETLSFNERMRLAEQRAAARTESQLRLVE